METKEQIKLLDSQIKNMYGNLLWTHKTHEKDADIYRLWSNILKICQIFLSAASSTSIAVALLGDNKIAGYITAIISFLLVILNSYMKGSNLESLSEKHGSTAVRLVGLREDYLSLLYDIKSININVEETLVSRLN